MNQIRTDAQRRAHAKYYAINREKAKQRTADWREANREYYLTNLKEFTNKRKALDPEAAKRRARGYALKRKYGLTLEQYEELLDKQDRCCAICGKHENEFKTKMAVDHDHITLRIRGILCTHCNYRMVAKHTDGNLLRKIADYIEQGTEWYAPAKKPRKRGVKRVSK